MQASGISCSLSRNGRHWRCRRACMALLACRQAAHSIACPLYSRLVMTIQQEAPGMQGSEGLACAG